jgi:saccharopine dehydrogenase-like NADP-dependent oxidoreductase
MVVGGGAAGQVVSSHLVRCDGIDILRIADLDYGKVKRYSDWLHNDNVTVHRLDASNVSAVAKLARGMDVVVNALEPIFNLPLMRAALRAGTNYQDLAFGPPYEILTSQLKQDLRWKKAGKTALIATGNTPGITNILASKGADELDSVEGIEIRVFSRLNSDELISTWSPATMIQDMQEEPTVYENGQFKRVPPFSGQEVYPFPEPVGSQTISYHAHEEPHTLPRFIGKGIRYVGFKYGVNRFMHDLLRVGLLSKRPINVKGIKVAPVDVVIACYPKPSGMEALSAQIKSGILKGSVGCDAIEVWGKKGSGDTRRRYFVHWPDIIDINRSMPHATHTSYMAGTGAVILTEALARGRIQLKGVVAPENLERSIREDFLAELSRRNIAVEEVSQ